MHKLLIYILLLLTGCASKQSNDSETIRVVLLRGPSAISFVEWFSDSMTIANKKIEITITDSPEQVQALMIKGEAEIVALPMINAANLYNKGINYQLAGCPVWGNLYMVEKGEASGTPELHIFGAGTTPDILARYYCRKNELDYSYNYSFPTVREIVQGIHAGKTNRAVLAEPYLSMVLRQDSTIRISADLNKPDEQTTGFPQTAVLLHPAMATYKEIIDSLLTKSSEYANTYPTETIRILEKKAIFPEGVLSAESIQRCNIHYQTAASTRDMIYHFLQLICEYEPRAIGEKLPDQSFILPGL